MTTAFGGFYVYFEIFYYKDVKVGSVVIVVLPLVGSSLDFPSYMNNIADNVHKRCIDLRDGNAPISSIQKYLMKKLGLTSEAEVSELF